MKKYIAVTTVFYKFKNPNKLRYKDFRTNSYSHHLLEQSILKSNELTKNYLALIKECIDGTYIQDYKKGQRCLIFCISVEMCTVVSEYLKTVYKDKVVGKYTQGDSYDGLVRDNDITVSTLLKSGTAVDVPNLSTAILTIAINSIQANLQSLGRLREMKDGSTPRFVYFACTDIAKHIEYHERKKTNIADRVASHNSIFISKEI